MRRTRRTLALPLWLSLTAAGAFAGPLGCAPSPGETLGTSASFIVSGVATSVVRVAVTATSVPAGRTYTTDLVRVGDNWQGTLSGMLVGAYSFAGTAYDATGNVLFRGSLSSPVTIANNGTSMVALNLTQASQIAAFRNNAPVIDTLVGSSNAIVPSDTISLAATAHDPDADPLTYAWSASAGTFSAPNALATTWTAPATEGTYTLTLVVSDNRGASTSARYQVRVAVANGRGSAALNVSLNNAPVISGFTVGGSDATGTSNLTVMATDPDGDTLTYSWSSSCAGYFAGSTTNNRALNNSPSPSTTFTQTPATVACTLTVVVRDGMGNSNTATVIRGAGPTTNTNPVVAPSFQSVNGVGNAGTVILRAEGSDPDGTPVTLAWTTSLGTLSAPRAYTGSAGTSVAQEVTWTAPDCFPMGMATVTVTATDPGGLTAARTFTIASTNAFNLQTDATNCGACGNVCPSPGANGVAACVAGACQLSCVSGYHLVGSACVVDTDTMSCGPTGTLCATPNNAAPTCDGTTCGFSCNASFGDCDSNASNGCESSLPTDPNNCGACGHVCSDHGYSTPVCNAGSCDFVCRTGYGNCDGDPGNGCETDVNVNSSHCGACGNACVGNTHCASGGCTWNPECLDSLVPPGENCPRNYRVQSGRNSSTVLTVVYGGATPMTVSQYTWNGDTAQGWRLLPVAGSNAFELRSLVAENAGRAMCLDLFGNLGSYNNQIELSDCNGSTAQHWLFVPSADGSYELKPEAYADPFGANNCLDTRDGDVSNGATIALRPCTGDPAQRWRFY